MLGIINHNADDMLNTMTYIILMTKWYIADTKRRDQDTSLYNFLRLLKYRLEIERTLQIMDNNLQAFKKKWSHLYDSL